MAQGLSPGDPNSYSRPDEAVVTDIHLKLDVNFNLKVLSGTANLTVKRKTASRLILDIGKDMNIRQIINAKTGEALEYKIDEEILTFGSKLEMKLPKDGDKDVNNSTDQGCGCIFVISITYDTSPEATALQWLAPEQTAGRVHPYLFSQCEPIHCRTLIPCQDTPSVKMTYSAEITAPAALVVLMSAARVGEPRLEGDGKVYSFKQSVPIPSYLVAIAVGGLESRRLGPRSHVWSEKEIVDKAAYEFSETEQMLLAAEAICGPYVWGSYDLLVMPPSFPFGGMENPCLTFVTPTLLAGDRSLANVVAHEIAHSWTGNLVTNRNFEHFWLNEGFTVFVERKIVELLHNTERRHFAAIGGLKDLADTIKHRGENDPLTCLVTDLKGVDPDFAFSTVPYEKGHTFLFYLEELLGGPEAFDPFLKAYVEKFKYKSIDTDDFKSFLQSFFSENKKLDEVNWDLWLHTPGMPPIIPKYNMAMANACTALANKWKQWDETTPSPFTAEDLKTLISIEIEEFLGQLLEHDPLSVVKLKAMRDTYSLNGNRNAEIRVRWLRLCIKGKFTEQIDLALEFATEQGRMKFVRPIFRELYQWPEAREKAVRTFMESRSNMMYLTSSSVAKDLNIE